MKSSIISRRRQEMVVFLGLVLYLLVLIAVNTTGFWCSAAGKKNKFLS